MARAFDANYTGGGLLAVFVALVFGIARAPVEVEKNVTGDITATAYILRIGENRPLSNLRMSMYLLIHIKLGILLAEIYL